MQMLQASIDLKHAQIFRELEMSISQKSTARATPKQAAVYWARRNNVLDKQYQHCSKKYWYTTPGVTDFRQIPNGTEFFLHSPVSWCKCEDLETQGNGQECGVDVACSVQLSGLWESQAGLSQELQLKKNQYANTQISQLHSAKSQAWSASLTELWPMSPGPIKGTEHIPWTRISGGVWHPKREQGWLDSSLLHRKN